MKKSSPIRLPTSGVEPEPPFFGRSRKKGAVLAPALASYSTVCLIFKDKNFLQSCNKLSCDVSEEQSKALSPERRKGNFHDFVTAKNDVVELEPGQNGSAALHCSHQNLVFERHNMELCRYCCNRARAHYVQGQSPQPGIRKGSAVRN